MARWWVKKAARQAAVLGSWASGSMVARRAVRRRPRVRALTYHRVGYEPREAFCVTPEAFDAQMRFLAERGLAVSLAQVQAFVAGRETLPDGACLVTLDDGCISTLDPALPILERHGVPAVAFITTSLVGANIEELPERFLTWDEIRAVAASGLVAIGSHAFTHRSLGMMDPEEARDEARRSRETLEEHLGHAVASFAYPFGTRGDFSPVTERGLADAGYAIAFNSMHGTIKPGMDPISLPRVKVEGGEGQWMFELLSQGAMDAWRVVDHNLFHLQRVRTELE
ncbi:MAG TPA: polysaccharide deacetylase family protein [Sandaracinaceae bacterium LLY-WYZ-13_1]|nr:polysaccharide deacetylase family protein [Sandaracinaceae bacterium LLY-WYZ-13_1]